MFIFQQDVQYLLDVTEFEQSFNIVLLILRAKLFTLYLSMEFDYLIFKFNNNYLKSTSHNNFIEFHYSLSNLDFLFIIISHFLNEKSYRCVLLSCFFINLFNKITHITEGVIKKTESIPMHFLMHKINI